MKKIWLAILISACSPPAPPQQAVPQLPVPVNTEHGTIVDAQNGYDGHHLGDSLSSFKGVPLKLVPRLWPATMYVIPSHNEHFDTLRLDGLGYEFWQGKLYRINFNSRRPGLLAAGKRLYGPGMQVGSTDYYWQGHHASATYSVNGEWTYLRIYDNTAAAQVDSAVQAARIE